MSDKDRQKKDGQDKNKKNQRMKQKKFAGNNSTETQSQQTGVKDSETSRLSPATARTYASKANKGK